MRRSPGAADRWGLLAGMSRAHVAVLKICSGELSVTESAAEYGFSRRHLHRLLAAYRAGGLEALEPRSRAPRSSPHATPELVRVRVVQLRGQLVADGLDAGPHTIAWHLEQEGFRAPAPATISRIVSQAGLVTPQPRKRPRSSYIRFEAAQPNECWQSDFMHTRLADGSDVEILSWLDDHSRFLLGCSAHQPVTGDTVVTTFLETIDLHGPPASTLTDNGRVYTARFGGGRNAFEYLLPILGVRQKNGHPGHPQTQGKIERFHQTLQRWLAARPPASNLAGLQHQLDQFRDHYNEHRPHRALDRRTPHSAYRATPKALPAGPLPQNHYRLRYDRLCKKGSMTLRRASRMHHLGVGAAHAGKRVLALVDDHQVTIIELHTGEILSTHLIQPDKAYWRNQQKEPGRWPDSRN
jgi:transposase InsO family protein